MEGIRNMTVQVPVGHGWRIRSFLDLAVIGYFKSHLHIIAASDRCGWLGPVACH
jgi:hypothetical protein